MLVGGTATAQLLTIIAAPILTRLYSPEDFGLLSVYGGLLGLFTVIASLRYELAIPICVGNKEVANTVALCVVLVVGMASLAGLVVVFFGDFIVNYLAVPKLSQYFWLLPCGVLLIGIYQVFNYYSIRTKEFSLVATTKIYQAIVTIFIQIVCFKIGALALLLGQVMGQGVGGFKLAKSALMTLDFRDVTVNGIKESVFRYKKFPLFSTWGGFFNTAGQQLPPLMLAAIFGPSAAGFYALSNRVLAMPMAVVGQAVGNVFFANAVEAHNNGKLGNLLSSVHKKLVLIIVPPILILGLVAPDIFELVFGPEWRLSGSIASWLSLWLFVSFTTSPVSNVFSIVERQSVGMVMQGFILTVRVVGLFIGSMSGEIIYTIAAFSISNLIAYLIYLIVVFWIAEAPLMDILKNYLNPVIFAVLVYLSIDYFSSQYFINTGLLMLFLFVVSCVYYMYMYFRYAND